jgi:hypothetical protein
MVARETMTVSAIVSASTSASDYSTLVAQCHTQNQFNRLHIDLESILAPAEIGDLAQLAGDRGLPTLSHDWLQRLKDLSPSLFDAPRPFQRVALTDTLLLYRDPRREPTEKSLLVAFTGGSRRLLLPISVILQHLDSEAWDVVVLRRGPERRPYSQGLESVSRSFPAVIRYVEKVTSAKQYRRVVTLGTSSGGFAALMGAILMGVPRGVSICGGLPQLLPDRWLRFQLAFRRALGAKPRFELVYGANFDPDHRGALTLQAMFGGRLRSVPGVTTHNPLRVLLARGELSAFLDQILD